MSKINQNNFEKLLKDCVQGTVASGKPMEGFAELCDIARASDYFHEFALDTTATVIHNAKNCKDRSQGLLDGVSTVFLMGILLGAKFAIENVDNDGTEEKQADRDTATVA